MATDWHPGRLLSVGFDGTEVPEDLAEQIAAGRIGGVVLFSRNISGPEGLRRLVRHLHSLAPADRPLLVSIDQEGGRVQRLRAPWTEWPSMRCLGLAGDTAATREVGAALGRELLDLGIDLDFAPVLDVDTNPANPVIGDRSFAVDAESVARQGVALIEGLQGAGVAACAKHFPGHGDTDLDSHTDLPRVAHSIERLRAIEWRPFRAAAEAGVASMMTAHVVVSALDPDWPATLSPRALHVLRDEIDYDGVVFSDDLEMAAIAEHWPPGEAARRALEAGCDALLSCARRESRLQILAALEAMPIARLDEARRRCEALEQRYAGPRAEALAQGPPYPQHAALAQQIAGALPGGTQRPGGSA